MGTFFHVVLSVEGSKPFFLYGNMTAKELRKKFLRPYKLGEKVLQKNEVVDLSKVKSLEIIQTSNSLEEELKKIQEKSRKEIDDFNRDSDGVTLISAGAGWRNEDIVCGGQNVTAQYISRPPGKGTFSSKLMATMHNPWVLGLGTPALLALGTLIVKNLIP